MLPDFPKVKAEFRKILLRRMDQMIAERAPMAGRLGVFRQWEGSQFSYEDNTGAIRNSASKEVSTKFSFPKNLTPTKNLEQMFEALRGAAEDMAKQSETMLFTTLDEVTKESGNVFDAGGRPFEPSMLLDNLEKMHIDFDEHGKPEMPTIVLHPDLFKSIKDRLAEWDADPKIKLRREQILAAKKEEWRDRESNRKLVG
jgi:hypothetical protein